MLLGTPNDGDDDKVKRKLGSIVKNMIDKWSITHVVEVICTSKIGIFFVPFSIIFAENLRHKSEEILDNVMTKLKVSNLYLLFKYTMVMLCVTVY